MPRKGKVASGGSSRRKRPTAKQLPAQLSRRAAAEEGRGRLDRFADPSQVRATGETVLALVHELNQPLSSIANYARACSCQLQTSPGENVRQLQEFLEQIVEQADRAGEILRRLRTSGLRAPPQRRLIDANALVRGATRLLQAEARDQHVRLETALDPSLPRVAADRGQMEQVIMNLGRNAVQAAAESGRDKPAVRIRTSKRPEGAVEVVVEDNGKGLQNGEIDRLFEPFYTTKPDGMGLGLWISRSIVEAHGGCLEASPNADRGATFRFCLPACRQEVPR